jgi:hypothetical protein
LPEEALFNCLHPLGPVEADSCPWIGHRDRREVAQYPERVEEDQSVEHLFWKRGRYERRVDRRSVEKSAWSSGSWSCRSLVNWLTALQSTSM